MKMSLKLFMDAILKHQLQRLENQLTEVIDLQQQGGHQVCRITFAQLYLRITQY